MVGDGCRGCRHIGVQCDGPHKNVQHYTQIMCCLTCLPLYSFQRRRHKASEAQKSHLGSSHGFNLCACGGTFNHLANYSPLCKCDGPHKNVQHYIQNVLLDIFATLLIPAKYRRRHKASEAQKSHPSSNHVFKLCVCSGSFNHLVNYTPL